MQFHPKIYECLLKCYFYIGNFSFDYFLKIIKILPLSKKYDLEAEKDKTREEILSTAKKNNDESLIDIYENTYWGTKKLHNKLYLSLKEYLESLPFEDIIKLLSDIFPSSEFRRMQGNNWNHYGEVIEDWRKDLIHHLEIGGIYYDEEKRQFLEKGDEISLEKVIYKTDILKCKFDDIFYNNLISEINRAYKIGAYTGAFILCRKLIENLVIEILRKKFPPNAKNLEIYYKEKENRFQDFSILIENLDLKKEEFNIDKELIEEVISLIKPFRPTSNSKTHSIIIIGNEEDINNFKIERIVGLLIRIEKGIK